MNKTLYRILAVTITTAGLFAVYHFWGFTTFLAAAALSLLSYGDGFIRARW